MQIQGWAQTSDFKTYQTDFVIFYSQDIVLQESLCNNQHKSDVVEIEKGQMNDVLLQSGLLITQPLWEAH